MFSKFILRSRLPTKIHFFSRKKRPLFVSFFPNCEFFTLHQPLDSSTLVSLNKTINEHCPPHGKLLCNITIFDDLIVLCKQLVMDSWSNCSIMKFVFDYWWYLRWTVKPRLDGQHWMCDCFVKLYINVIWAKCHSHRTPWHFNQTSRGKQQERDESTIVIRKLSRSKIKDDCANSAVAYKAVRNINSENTHTHVESQIRFIELEGGCVNGERVRMSLISQDLLRTWAVKKTKTSEGRGHIHHQHPCFP